MKNENKKIARLIKQIQKGKQSAFDEFYKLTSSKAYFLALKITQNEHDAEDILQESYIKALEKINEIDTSQNINSWFLTIVSNKSKDLLKSRNRLVFEGEEETIFEEIPEEKAEFCPEENLNQEELRLEVMAAIDELTAEKRACIMMMYFGDMSVKEIAESIEVPESTVKNRLYTARKDLKTRFEKNGNILYGAALGGVLVWALSKTGETTASAFAASDTVLAGVNSASVSSSAAATGTGIAAKVAALSAAQKVVAGVAATAVIGGSAAGVATVAKKIVSSNETTTYIEEVTTAPSQTTEYIFAVITTESTTDETSTEASSQKENPTSSATSKREPTATTETSTEVTETENPTTAVTTQKRTRRTTTRRDYSLYTSTATQTTTQISTTKETTTQRTTTKKIETETQEETTTRPETTHTTEPSTTETTTETTTQTTTETTTEATTQAPATLVIEVVDMNDEVVDTLNLTVEPGTEMTWEYLVSLISQNGYEAQAGIYGDGVGAVAEAGTTYTFTAEL